MTNKNHKLECFLWGLMGSFVGWFIGHLLILAIFQHV